MQVLQFDGCLEVASGEDPGISFVIETRQNQLQVVFPDWKTAWKSRSFAKILQQFKKIPLPADSRLDTSMLLMIGSEQRGEVLLRDGEIQFKPFYLRWVLS